MASYIIPTDDVEDGPAGRTVVRVYDHDGQWLVVLADQVTEHDRDARPTEDEALSLARKWVAEVNADVAAPLEPSEDAIQRILAGFDGEHGEHRIRQLFKWHVAGRQPVRVRVAIESLATGCLSVIRDAELAFAHVATAKAIIENGKLVGVRVMFDLEAQAESELREVNGRA